MDRIEQNCTISADSGLTPLQEQAATLLASGKNISAVAEELNLNRGTIYQWQQKITFQCFFNSQRKEAKETLENGLFGLYDEALTAVKECLTSKNETIRLKAAMYVIGKVEECPMDNTDVRAVLRSQATTKKDFLSEYESKKYFFDEEEYERLLGENGLK